MPKSQMNLMQKQHAKTIKTKRKPVSTASNEPSMPLGSLLKEKSLQIKKRGFQRLYKNGTPNEQKISVHHGNDLADSKDFSILQSIKMEYPNKTTSESSQVCIMETPKLADAKTNNNNTLTSAAAVLCNGKVTTIVNCCRNMNCNMDDVRQTSMSACPFSPERHSTKENTNNASQHKRSKSLKFVLNTEETSIQERENNVRQQQEHNQQYSDNYLVTYSWPFPLNKYLQWPPSSTFILKIQLDLFSIFLFIIAFGTRFYRLNSPRYVVFDELHYGKLISHYVRNTFFIGNDPPFGKQLIAALMSTIGYTGNFTVSHIGSKYPEDIPIFWFRFIPALCGSLLPTGTYNLLLESGLSRWCSFLGGMLVITDNALLTQSRFILMESMLLCFTIWGLTVLLRFQKKQVLSPLWLFYGIIAASLLTCALSIKYVAFFTFLLAIHIILRNFWDQLLNYTKTNFQLCLEALVQFVIFTIVPLCIYLLIFYIHLQTLQNAGPYDSVMSSAFQASLDGGLASITKGQPLNVAHGSQITLRHSHGRACWLHSHAQVYPVRYSDNRGSSHQQQVTCYSFKDVNNWWIVKRPDTDDLVVDVIPDVIRDGDIIQLVHGITSRALNSHDVAAPITPRCQEISCYIDYDINMKAELLWRVDIVNKQTEGSIWHAIKSEVRLIHVTTGAALRYTGQQLPEWGFNQHEVAGDRTIESKDTIWNVEEHRYTKVQDEREREKQLLKAEMLPTEPTKLTFFQKFVELQKKLLWQSQQVQTHMYSSDPLEWPLLTKGIAYWVDDKSNSQIYLLGNLYIWCTGSIAAILYLVFGLFYVIRRHRLCYDIDDNEWRRFRFFGDVHFIGYLIHYIPYFFIDRTLFLHNYLPALLFKIHILCYMIEHVDYLLMKYCCSPHKLRRSSLIVLFYRFLVLCWSFAVIVFYIRFLPITYGLRELSTAELIQLRLKDTWLFVLQ